MTGILGTYRTWGMDTDKGDDWRTRAACRPGSGVDPEVFFPVGTDPYGRGRVTERQYNDALRVCYRCPVREACGWDAIDRGENYGIWGGTTPDRRREIAEAVRSGVIQRPAHLRPMAGAR